VQSIDAGWSGAGARVAIATRQAVAVVDRACFGRRAAIAQALSADSAVAGGESICASSHERRRRRRATFRLGRFKPLRIVEQTATRPAAEGLGFIVGDVHGRLVIGGGLAASQPDQKRFFYFYFYLDRRNLATFPQTVSGLKVTECKISKSRRKDLTPIYPFGD
jgi:hypothetical protein